MDNMVNLLSNKLVHTNTNFCYNVRHRYPGGWILLVGGLMIMLLE